MDSIYYSPILKNDNAIIFSIIIVADVNLSKHVAYLFLMFVYVNYILQILCLFYMGCSFWITESYVMEYAGIL